MNKIFKALDKPGSWNRYLWLSMRHCERYAKHCASCGGSIGLIESYLKSVRSYRDMLGLS